MAPRHSTGAGAEAELPEYDGHYRLESQLGFGGMGVVHLARSASGMRVAVKVVHAEFARDPEFRGRFRQEVGAARRVSGAFTAPVVDADPEAARPWMATLFIPGPTLSQQVKRNGPLEPALVRRLMAGLAEALRDIHRVGVVHRDLKPGNVLLAEDGPKVIDFGISRPKDSELRTETGKLIGTPPFMAPEQFRRPREVGPAADVFALGSVIVHAATGRGPFDSDSPYVVAYQVVHDEPELAGVPQDLAPLVRRCLAKEPEDRPTPDELMLALRSVAASYDTQAFIPSQRKGGADGGGDAPQQEESGAAPESAPPKRPWWRGRAVLAATAAVLAVGGVVASVQWAGAGQGQGARPQAAPAVSTAAGFDGWRSEAVAGVPGAPRCVLGAGRLLCTASGAVFALDPVKGSVVWRRAFAGALWSDPPVLSGGSLRLRNQSGRLTALDPGTGRTRGERELTGDTGTRYIGDTLVTTRADGVVMGAESGSGREKWRLPLPDGTRPRIDAFGAGSDGYATVTSADGRSTRVTAFDSASGAERWSQRMSGMVEPVGAEGGFVYFLDDDPVYGDTKGLVRYEVKSGATRRVPLLGPRPDAQATVRDGVVYLLAANGGLDAVDMGAGKPVWHLETTVSRGSAPVTDGRRVYFSAADGRLLAVDARRGTTAGQTRPRLGARADRVTAGLPTPVLGWGHVYAGAPDGSVFAVNTADPAAW